MGQLTSNTRYPWSTVRTPAGILLQKLYGWLGRPRVELRLWTDEEVGAGERSVAAFVIDDFTALLRLLADPEMQFGEMYMAGRIRLERGSLVAALEEVLRRKIVSCYSQLISRPTHPQPAASPS